MNTAAAGVLSQAAKPTSAARTRALRERQRLGVRLVRVRINETEIEALERLGYLAPGQREDAGSIQKAVELLVSDTPLM
jgi:hypothetical protein